MQPKTIKKLTLLVLGAVLSVSQLTAQTFNAFISAAEEAMQNENYYSATSYYKEALEFDESNMDVKYNYAIASKKFNAYSQAETLLSQIVEADSTNQFPMATYELADVQQRMGKYDDAKTNYELFVSEYTLDENKVMQAKNEIEACNWAQEHTDMPMLRADVERLNDEINTPYSEFGAFSMDDELYYSSLRFEKTDEKVTPKRTFAKILKSMDDELAGEVLENGDINGSPRHVAHTSITEDGKYIFYTMCDFVTAEDIRCDIYYRLIEVDGSYGEAVALPNYINNPELTSTQPNVTIDTTTNEVTLYYTSDRPSPFGEDMGLDIWKTVMKPDGTFTEPENVSGINTAGDEITPYYHRASKTLYFSANSGFRYGGFDIFKAAANGDKFQERVNLGSEINTSYNDIYYSVSKDGELAYFSSNRVGTNYLETQSEACCYDIYKASIEPLVIQLEALTFNKKDLSELHGATVGLYDSVTNELIDEITVDTSNIHTFMIESGREYTLIGSKNGFKSDTIMFTTFDATDSLMTKKLFLESTCIELDLRTFVKDSGIPLNGVTVTIEDLTNPDNPKIRRYDPNSNNYKVCLEKDKEYKITATKDGYEPSTILVDTRPDDIGDSISRTIYLAKKLPNLVTMLPVVLYFDNDQPDNNTYNLITRKTYTDTYYPYIAREETFKSEYTKPLSPSEKAFAAARIESFFREDVRGGYTQMQEFLNNLANRLQTGERFEISIQGYTSPRATNQYNKALGMRRVFSVKNELKDFNGGVLSQYLDSGALRVKEVSFGEEQAPSGINDDYNNRRESIYSVEASRERKATIVDLTKLN